MKSFVQWSIKKLGIVFSSLAVTIFIILLLEQALPDFLVQMLLGTNEESYPITFQTIMWFPFALGLVVLFNRGLGYYENIRNFRHSIDQLENLELDNSETLNSLINAYSDVKHHHTNNTYLYLYLSGLETLNYSTRYNDVKDEVEATSNALFTNIDSAYSKIKYLAWLLPTLGFMGTVYGISISVASFGMMSPDSPDFLSSIAENLAVAFNTTLLSLIQSSIIVLIVTFMENMENDFISSSVVKIQNSLRRQIRQIDPQKFFSRSA